MAAQKFRKYFIKGSILPFEEDQKIEFKGHLNLCKEEIPIWACEKKNEKASRKSVSRNLNAFLNSGTGGTVFIGVVDNGKVMGMSRTRLQRDHFLKSLDDLMSRYTPKVLPHQYTVRFTPVFDSSSTADDILRQLEIIGSEQVGDVYKDRKHVLRTNNYCWCDKDSVAAFNVSNKTAQHFVIEVILRPWDPHDPRNPTVGRDDLIRIQPYYADEEGKVYFRRQASVVQYNFSSIVQITKQEVKDRYEEEIKRLQEQLEELRRKKASREPLKIPS